MFRQLNLVCTYNIKPTTVLVEIRETIINEEKHTFTSQLEIHRATYMYMLQINDFVIFMDKNTRI